MFKTFISILLFSVFSANCKTVRREHSSAAGLVDKDLTLWPNGTIDICWGPNDLGNLDKLKNYLKDEITKEFARADIKIRGWKPCPDTITDGGPYSFNLTMRETSFTNGTGYKARMGGVNVDIADLGPEVKSCYVKGSKFVADICALSTAIHEFGHFVALDHEHERIDTWKKCAYRAFSKEAAGIKTNFGDYDDDSVMSYCRDDYLGLSLRKPSTSLSARDIATIKAVYSNTATFLKSNSRSNNSFIDQEELQVDIVDNHTKEYRYQVVYSDIIAEKPCPLRDYSQNWIPASRGINVDIKKYKSGVIKVCVLGKNAAGNVQDPNVYSSLSYIIDRTPVADLVGEVEIVTEQNASFQVMGDGVVSYMYKLIDLAKLPSAFDFDTLEEKFNATNPCLVDTGYSDAVPISKPMELKILGGPGQYEICLRGIDANGQKQTVIKTTRRVFEYAPEGA